MLPSQAATVPAPMEPVPLPDPGDDPPPGHPLLDPSWAGEVKWDGIRLLAACDGGRARLFSRRLRERTTAYPEVEETLARHGLARRQAVLDGEVAVFVAGRPSFPAVLRRENAGGRARTLADALPATYLVFDLLAVDGRDLRALAWDTRRRRLAETLGEQEPGAPVRLSPAWIPGLTVLRQVRARQLEGVVLKRRESRYADGRRSRDWLKIKVRRQLEAVVGGYTTKRGRLAALLLGLYRSPFPGEAGEEGGGMPAPRLGEPAAAPDARPLVYVGRVGSGFPEEEGARLRGLLSLLVRPSPPFAAGGPHLPRDPETVVRWTEPLLTAVVEFLEWTDALRLRAPVYLGLGRSAPGSCLLP